MEMEMEMEMGWARDKTEIGMQVCSRG